MAGTRMAIFDNHFHLRPTGLGVAAAKQFEAAGGTAMMLTHSPYDDLPIRRAEDYTTAYARTLDLARQVRAATRLKVFVALGPYPVDLLPLRDSIGLGAATDVLRRGVEIAGRHVAEGEAVAIGEVGRPHFPVDPEAWRASNEILAHAMEVARERACAVILHTEDPTRDTFREFATMADATGLSRSRVVKHHSTPLTKRVDNQGIVPSILAKEDLFLEAVKGDPFFLETDYIDDPRRPGAVLGPATVPRKTRTWLERGVLTEDLAARIHTELPRQTYGVDLD
jgi:TatD-related deoxyribonuclease